MTARSSKHTANAPSIRRLNERGGMITILALAIVAIFFLLGLSIDLGSAYVMRSRLSKAVDAGVLAGARNTARGDARMREAAIDVANANYSSTPDRQVYYSVAITTPAVDTKRISMSASTGTRTNFAVLMGKTSLDIATGAEATRYPLDLSLLLDLSASLERNNAFDDLQDASKAFLQYFDESTDQVGIATYSTTGAQAMPVQKFFKGPGASTINGLSALTDTNIQEGLRASKTQLDNAFQRAKALKVVVLFTDGRPTAFRDTFKFVDVFCPSYNGVIATYISGESYRGLFRHNNALKVIGFKAGCATTTTSNTSGTPSPIPTALFNGSLVTGDAIRAGGVAKAEEMANTLRAAGYSIYAIGLGNPNATNEGDQPDLEFLRRVANERGRTNASQPRGEVFFAPSPEQLDDQFAKLADRLLTRLTR